MKVTREDIGIKCEESKGVTERQDEGVFGDQEGGVTLEV